VLLHEVVRSVPSDQIFYALSCVKERLRGRLKSPSGACADRCKLPKIRSASFQLESFRRQAGGMRSCAWHEHELIR